MSGISCASLEPPTYFSTGESLNDSTLKQRDIKEQSGEAEEVSDNGTCDETRELETVAERIGMCFPESNNHVADADDSSPIIKQDRESCLPNPGPILRCPYLDEVSDSTSRYGSSFTRKWLSRTNNFTNILLITRILRAETLLTMHLRGFAFIWNFCKASNLLFAAFRLRLARGGIVGPMQMTQRQMKHPFLVKKMQAVILISLSGQRFVDFESFLCVLLILVTLRS